MNRRASSRMSSRCSRRFGPSCIRAMAWIWSRISLLLGRSPGRWRYSTPSCLAALRLAVKYSDSVRRYIIWAARKAIWRRMRSSAMWEVRRFEPIEAARGRWVVDDRIGTLCGPTGAREQDEKRAGHHSMET